MTITAKMHLLFVTFSVCILGCALSTSYKDDYDAAERRTIRQIKHAYKTNPIYAKMYNQWMKSQLEPLLNACFPCEPLPPSKKVPSSVHKLRPGDIKVIGAVGDSLTAGRGVINGAIGLLFDYPQLSWSIGGEGNYDKYITLPNILRHYNPNLKGASESRRKWHLNKAKTMAQSAAMLEEVQALTETIENDKSISFEEDWKLITFFIGGNDICAICKNYTLYQPDNYIKNVRTALDYLHQNLPRTFVNLVELINVEMVQELNKNLLCDAVHIYACVCGAYPKNEQARTTLIKYREEYQIGLRKLAESGRYDSKDDFTVVLQPFYRETYPPYKSDGSIDLSYFASDCFHQSSKGQQAAAKALWNNMVEPVGSKRMEWHPDEGLECPTKRRPFLFTNKNSG